MLWWWLTGQWLFASLHWRVDNKRPNTDIKPGLHCFYPQCFLFLPFRARFGICWGFSSFILRRFLWATIHRRLNWSDMLSFFHSPSQPVVSSFFYPRNSPIDQSSQGNSIDSIIFNHPSSWHHHSPNNYSTPTQSTQTAPGRKNSVTHPAQTQQGPVKVPGYLRRILWWARSFFYFPPPPCTLASLRSQTKPWLFFVPLHSSQEIIIL